MSSQSALPTSLADALVRSCPDALVAVSETATVVAWNPGASRLFGHAEREAVGASWLDLVVPADGRGEGERALQQALDTGRWAGEAMRRCKDGPAIRVETTICRIDSDQLADPQTGPGESRARLALYDKEAVSRERLAVLRRRCIEEAGRLKSELLANMSHELRTPLNSIIGFAKLMHHGKVGQVSSQHREFLNDIVSSGEHLLALVNGVIDLAKFEAGSMEFHPEPLDLEQVATEMREVIGARAATKQIRLEIAIDPTCRRLELDRSKLREVLYNYLSNAVRVTERGRIEIRARPEGAERVRIEVSDTGVGIRPEELPKLFVEFARIAEDDGREPGRGLGLAVTKKIVEAQGGWTGVESTFGEGSTFFAVLPRAMGRDGRGVKAPGVPAG